MKHYKGCRCKTQLVCKRCGHKVIKSKKHKSGYKHDNSVYDTVSRCRVCVTEGRWCKYVKEIERKQNDN